MAESFSVKAVLSAVDKGFTSTIAGAIGSVKSLAGSVASGMLMGAGMAAFHTLTSGAASMAAEVNTANKAWKTYAANMQILGKGADEVAQFRQELQSFAEASIYSSSEMASTYAQLASVGVAGAEKLVKGFGGLAAAAENPKQAMNTLSQQATQMAARPKVAWMDFKLMLEQSPAGMAAVARQMGMTSDQLVSKIQAGEIATKDFFAAVEEVGNSEAFQDLAKSYKGVDEAMDGLQETVANKLTPAFNEMSNVGIRAVEAVIDKVSGLDGDRITAKMQPFVRAADAMIAAFSGGGISGAIGEITNQMGQASAAAKSFGAALGAAAAVMAADKAVSFAQGFKSVSGVFSDMKPPPFMTKGFNLKALTNSAVNSTRRIGTAFGKMGKGLTGYCGLIAGSLAEISPKLDNMAMSIWGGFESAGNAVAGFGKKISKGMGSGIKTVGAFAQRISNVLAPVTSLVGKVGNKIFSGLTSMMGMALKALMPAAMIGAAVAGLGLLYQTYGSQIDSILAMAREKGPGIIAGLANGITSALPGLMTSGAQMLTGLMNTITANIPAIVSAGFQIISSLVSGLAAAAPTLLQSGAVMIGQLIVSIGSELPGLIVTGMQLILSLVQGVVANLPALINSGISAVTSFLGGIGQNLPAIASTGLEIMANLISGIIVGVGKLIASIPSLFKGVWNAIKSIDWISLGLSLIDAIYEGITGGLNVLFGGGKSCGQAAAAGIQSAAPQAVTAAQSTAQDAVNAMQAVVPQAKAAGQSTVSGWMLGMGSVDTSTVAAVENTIGAMAAASPAAATAGQTTAASWISGFDAMDISAKSAVSSVTTALASEAGSAAESGYKVGEGFNKGLENELSRSVTVANTGVDAVAAALRSGYQPAYSAGAYISQGFANGMLSMMAVIEAAAARMAAAAQKALEAKAKIASPSKVTTKSGRWWGMGFGNGILDMGRYVARAAETLFSIPNLRLPNLAVAYGGELSPDYDYFRNQEYVIVVPLEVDGREFARATAKYNQAELDRQQKRDSRKRGKV